MQQLTADEAGNRAAGRSMSPVFTWHQLVKCQDMLFMLRTFPLRDSCRVRPGRWRYDYDGQSWLQWWRNGNEHGLRLGFGPVASAHVYVVVDFFNIVFEARRISHGHSAFGCGETHIPVLRHVRDLTKCERLATLDWELFGFFVRSLPAPPTQHKIISGAAFGGAAEAHQVPA